MMMIKSMNEIMNPAMAKPRGFLKRPMKENRAPRNHTIQLTTITQLTKKDNKAKTKPAVPIPFERLSPCTMTVVFWLLVPASMTGCTWVAATQGC